MTNLLHSRVIEIKICLLYFSNKKIKDDYFLQSAKKLRTNLQSINVTGRYK